MSDFNNELTLKTFTFTDTINAKTMVKFFKLDDDFVGYEHCAIASKEVYEKTKKKMAKKKHSTSDFIKHMIKLAVNYKFEYKDDNMEDDVTFILTSSSVSEYKIHTKASPDGKFIVVTVAYIY